MCGCINHTDQHFDQEEQGGQQSEIIYVPHSFFRQWLA